MSGPPSTERETRAAREVTARAIRRLDVLKWLLLAGTAALAVGGGAVVAGLLSGQVGFAFRPTWIAASVVIFVVSGAVSLVRMRRERRRPSRRPAGQRASTEGHPPNRERGDGDG